MAVYKHGLALLQSVAVRDVLRLIEAGGPFAKLQKLSATRHGPQFFS